MSGFILSIGGTEPLSGSIPWIAADHVREVDCPECAVVFLGGSMPEIRRAAGLITDGDGGIFPERTPVGVQLITCGRCAMNTVSITSDDGETLTLSLNRAVVTLRGVCEPMEIPVQRGGRTDLTCMAEFAAEVLLGVITE